MDNQHRIIKGYRDLSQVEIDLMNEIKAEGERLQALVEKVMDHLERQKTHATTYAEHFGNSEELDRIRVAEPERWADWARGGFQTNLMYLTRAVAQPTTF